ncbi:MAG: hypothetical protein C5B53_12340 [Candidatus Melainabacteria bacterium]|nr:MAG: hypothetical protein C5B53_12340 [Candidatus Melainabacteria bacterium]
MKLITKRIPGVAVIILLLTVCTHAQHTSIQRQQSTVDQAAHNLTARLSSGPLETGATNVSTADADLVVSSGVVLPLTPQPVLKPTTMAAENSPSSRESRIWKTLLIAQHSAAAFDAWTTRRSIESGNGFERNILVRPFANSPAIYPALQLAPMAFDYLGHRLMRSRNRFFRNTWWIPQAASTTASLWCGSRNLRVADLKR